MIKYNRQDALLTSKVELPATANQTVVSDQVIDIGFTGGIDECHIVITCPKLDATDATATLTVLGCNTVNGEFEAVTGLSLTATATAATELRDRLPITCPRYLRLQGVTGATATTATTTAVLSIRV